MMDFTTTVAYQAIQAAKDLFNETIEKNHCGLVSENEFVAIEQIVDGMGMNVWMNLNPDSLYWAIINQAVIGLSVEQGIGHATYVYRFDYVANDYVIEFMPIYHGLIHLAFESGEMLQVSGDVVRNGEYFRYNGPQAKPEHHYEGSDYGTADVISAYATASLKNGVIYTATVTYDELLEAEQLAQFNFSGTDNVWNTGFKCEMQKKTALRRVLRTIFNQLGFHNPIYRERVRMLMSVEDNLWSNLKSSYQMEVERAKRDRKLNGHEEAKGPAIPQQKTTGHRPAQPQSRCIVSTGLRASDVIAQAKEQAVSNPTRQAFKPAQKTIDNENVSTHGFMNW